MDWTHAKEAQAGTAVESNRKAKLGETETYLEKGMEAEMAAKGYNFSELEKMAKIVSDGSTLLMAYAPTRGWKRWPKCCPMEAHC